MKHKVINRQRCRISGHRKQRECRAKYLEFHTKFGVKHTWKLLKRGHPWKSFKWADGVRFSALWNRWPCEGHRSKTPDFIQLFRLLLRTQQSTFFNVAVPTTAALIKRLKTSVILLEPLTARATSPSAPQPWPRPCPRVFKLRAEELWWGLNVKIKMQFRGGRGADKGEIKRGRIRSCLYGLIGFAASETFTLERDMLMACITNKQDEKSLKHL